MQSLSDQMYYYITFQESMWKSQSFNLVNIIKEKEMPDLRCQCENKNSVLNYKATKGSLYQFDTFPFSFSQGVVQLEILKDIQSKVNRKMPLVRDASWISLIRIKIRIKNVTISL